MRVTRETVFNDPHRFAMHSNDNLSKFGEWLNSSASVPLLSLANGDSASAPVFDSGKGSWLNEPLWTPIGGQESGAILSAPISSATTASTAAPQTESLPIGKLIGPLRRSPEVAGSSGTEKR